MYRVAARTSATEGPSSSGTSPSPAKGTSPFCSVIPWLLGRTYAFSGRVPEGLALLQAGLADMEAMALSPYHAVALVHEGEVLLLAGRLEEAAARVEHMLTLWRRASPGLNRSSRPGRCVCGGRSSPP